MNKGNHSEPHWYVDKDLIDNNLMVGQGVGHTSEEWDYQEFPQRYPIRFRMLDGDGEVYFEGRMSKCTLYGPEWIVFSPLDDLGKAYGCTDLQYKEDNSPWQGL